MRLNTLKSASGARKPAKRVGRGIGSGSGKTSGRGHKGQKARSGGFHKIGFEGGQMPLQRRLPKFGFNSRIARATAEIRLSVLNKLNEDVVDIKVLRKNSVISANIKYVKVMKSGNIARAITLKGLKITAGAKAAIEAVGGKVE
jgi:large subunit ribosomal protein L15